MRTVHLTAITACLMYSLYATATLAVGTSSLVSLPMPSSQHLVVRKPALAPFAYLKYCLANPGDCEQGRGEAVITLKSHALRQLRDVNLSVNRSIIPDYDAPDDEKWQADVATGDCEDYALTKRRHLIRLGWSPNALRIAIAYTPDDEGHAVLVVSTSSGDLVLDNRTGAILNWRDTDLKWVMIQSSANPLLWNNL